MTSSAWGFQHRLITVSMCLCVFLAFGATLSADPYTFMPAAGISGLAIGGTSVLIVVSVVLEILKTVNSQMYMYSYDKFLD